MAETMTELMEAASRLGAEHGHNAGTWRIDGNTSHEVAERILQGYNDGDPEILDTVPWSDGGEELAEILLQFPEPGPEGESWSEVADRSAELEQAYALAYEQAYWAEVVRAAGYVTTHDVFGHPHDDGRATLTGTILTFGVSATLLAFVASIVSHAAQLLGGVS